MTTLFERAATERRRRPKTRHLVLVAILVFAWNALWGEASVANVLSGLVVSIAIVFGIGTWSDLQGVGFGRIRFKPMLRLGLLVGADLVRSTWTVAAEVLTPGEGDEAIIAVEVPKEARHHYLILVVGITVTPGTAVVDADLDNQMLYLHLLHRERRAEVEEHVQRLVELSCQAFPGPDEEAGS